jgi:hypothetical protein
MGEPGDIQTPEVRQIDRTCEPPSLMDPVNDWKSSWHWRYLVPIALFGFVCLAFLPSLQATFVNWDDRQLLFDQTAYRGFSAESFRWMLGTSYGGHFQPLTWLTYAVDWELCGTYPFGYHATNVLFHALTAVAFYFVARRLLVLGFGLSAAPRSPALIASAVFAALVFALHPLRAESVSWIAERRDVVSGVFFLLSIGCYLRYATGRHSSTVPNPQSPIAPPQADQSPFADPYYLAAVALCAVSLLAKASAMTMGLVLLILDLYPLRRLRTRDGGGGSSASGLLLEKIPFFALGLIAGVLALRAQREGGALETLAAHDIPSRLAQACYGLVFYIHKTLWPANLGPLYEIPPRSMLFGPMLWLSAAALVVILIVVVRYRRACPGLIAAFGIYTVIIFPTLGLVQSGRQLVADRYSYLSCLGWAVLAGAALLAHWRGRFPFSRRHRKASGALAAIVLIGALRWAGERQQDVWLGEDTLWSRGVAVSPDSAIANVNYADVLAGMEEYLAAIAYYRRGLQLNPDDVIAWHHLARIEGILGQDEAAMTSYWETLRRDPSRRGAHLPFAHLLVKHSRPRDAIRVLENGARRTPGEYGIVHYLAELLASHPDDEVRDGDAAVRWARELVEVSGDDDPVALLILATALAEAGRFEEGLAAAGRARVLAEETASQSLMREIDRRVGLLEAGKPVRMAVGESDS